MALILIVFISRSGLSVLHSIRNHDISSPSQSFEHLCNAAMSVKPLGILSHYFSAVQHRVSLPKTLNLRLYLQSWMLFVLLSFSPSLLDSLGGAVFCRAVRVE